MSAVQAGGCRLLCGLLGTVALGALAGARRTDAAYGRYLASINSSDVYVNVPASRTSSIARAARAAGLPVAALMGIRAALERGAGRRPAPVLATLLGSAAAAAQKPRRPRRGWPVRCWRGLLASP